MGRRKGGGQELGRYVRERRHVIGLTQQQLADAMSYEGRIVPPSWVSNLEAGRRTYLPDFEYIEALASALHVLPTDIMRGAGQNPVDLEDSSREAPGSHTIHALVDAINWVHDPQRRDITESFLRVFLDQDRKASRQEPSTVGSSHGRR